MTSRNQAEKSGSFVRDIEEIRRRAREHIENGAVTESYRGDRETVVRVLNEALATEPVCVLRYKRHYYMASGIHAQAVAAEFLEHAKEEQQHADKPSASPSWTRSPTSIPTCSPVAVTVNTYLVRASSR